MVMSMALSLRSKSQMTRNQFRDGNETRLQNYLRDTIKQALGASSVSGVVSRSIEKVS